MKKRSFVQSHPFHSFLDEDSSDSSLCSEYFGQCLKAIENLIDIDAYIIDYKNSRILYATQGSIHHTGRGSDKNCFRSFDSLDQIIADEDLKNVSTINAKVYEFFYSLPIERRLNCYFTQDFRIKTKDKSTVLINHKGTVLKLTDDGSLWLTLCIVSYPAHSKSGNSYIKMTDTNTVYEFIQSAGKFVEIKTQKLTLRATTVLELASSGRSEAQIAEILGISVNTVKYHKKKIFAKTGTNNTAGAICRINNQKKMVEQR